MAAEWYFQSMGEASGPLTAADLKQKVLTGHILEDTLVRRGASGRWLPAYQVQGLFPQGSVSSAYPEQTLSPPPFPHPSAITRVGMCSSQTVSSPHQPRDSGLLSLRTATLVAIVGLTIGFLLAVYCFWCNLQQIRGAENYGELALSMSKWLLKDVLLFGSLLVFLFVLHSKQRRS